MPMEGRPQGRPVGSHCVGGRKASSTRGGENQGLGPWGEDKRGHLGTQVCEQTPSGCAGIP